MANGTIAFDTLSTSGQISGTAVSVDTDYLAYGSAKSWGGANNAAVINDSLNVASSADNGTGQYTHNLTNAMNQDINNLGATTCIHTDSGVARYFGSGTTASAAKLRCVDEDFADEDHVHAFVIHGDLA